MKKSKKFVAFAILIAIPLLFFGIKGKAEMAKPPCYDWGYKSSTTWEGQCISCDCAVWDYTGKTECGG